MNGRRWSDYITRLRKERDLNRRAFAAVVGCDPSLITLVESTNHVPRRRALKRWADRLGVSREIMLLMAGYVPTDLTEREAKMLVAALRALKEVA